MINKILSIQNIGHFVDYNFSASKDNWNGELKKINIIYAPNGSGKTTFATILKSLKESSLTLSKFKHTFNSDESAYLKFIVNNNSIVEYKDESWSSFLPEIEVFDINFIEDYLFMGSVAKANNKTNLFKLILGEKGIEFRTRIKKLLRELKKIKTARPKKGETPETRETRVSEKQNELNKEVADFKDFSKEKYDNFIDAVNKNLKKFTTYIRLSEITYDETTEYEMFRIYMIFDVYGERVKFCLPTQNDDILTAKYALSEGDKSTIALSIFLSRFTMEGSENKIIVFDDPLSSFDFGRRSATITQLSKLANESTQFFLLTHDLHFAYDFFERNSFQISLLTLQIKVTQHGSRLSAFNIQEEHMDNTRRNLNVLKNFRDSIGSQNLIDVVRSIRPALEGIIKIKYFDEIESNIWLGTIIERISTSTSNSRIHKLKTIKENLVQLNEYTQGFHHDSGNGDFLNPNIEELRNQVALFFETLDDI